MMRKLTILLGLTAVALSIPGALCLAQTPSAPIPTYVPPPKTQPNQPVMDQMTNIPYYTLENGMSSVLTLNNLAPTSTTAKVTIYNTKGEGHALQPIALDPHSYKQIDLNEVVPREDFSAGNVLVAYSGISMAVTCQVTVTSLDKRVSFESREPYEMQDMQDMMPFLSTKLVGIVSLPGRKAEGFLAVTNSGVAQDTVQISFGPKQKTITLSPRQTHLLRLNEEDEFAVRSADAKLVRLQYTGMPGDIITSGFVLNVEEGYSSAFTMSDPSLAGSTHLSGAHLLIGKPDQHMGFPEGTEFRSPLLLGNIGTDAVTAHILLDYTVKTSLEMSSIDQQGNATEDKFTTVSVGDITIPAGAVRRVELSEALAKIGDDPITEAGIDIDYGGEKGALIGQLVSVDQTGDYSLEVPVKDPASVTAGMEGVYPWTLEDGARTVVHLKNTTDQAVVGDLTFNYYENGAPKYYRHPRISLQPHQTIAIDIQELKDLKKPDALGQVFSPSATRGQAIWHQDTPYTMIGRAEQLNVTNGIASSFSCESNCCAYYSEDAFASPYPLTGAVGNQNGLYSYLQGTDCYGNPFGPTTNPNTYTWASGNTSIATTSPSSGNESTASYIAAGNTSISASALYHYYDNINGGCSCGGHTAYQPISSPAKSCSYTIQPSAGFATHCDDTKRTQSFQLGLSANDDPSYCKIGTVSCYPVSASSYHLELVSYTYDSVAQQCVLTYYATNEGDGTAGTVNAPATITIFGTSKTSTVASNGPVTCN
jgi:hypothetical protein